MIRTHPYTSHSGNPSAMSWVCLSFLVAWHTAGAAMPAEAGFESVELQSHTTPPPQPCRILPGLPPRCCCHIVTSPGCLLPLSSPQFQTQKLPTHTSTLTVNAFHPQLRKLLCPCLQQSHCHSDTVTRKHTCQPSTHKTGRLTAMPPAFRAPCPHPLLPPVISHWSATPHPLSEVLHGPGWGGPDKEEPSGPLYAWLQVSTFANDQLAEWLGGSLGQVTSGKVKLSDGTLNSSSVT